MLFHQKAVVFVSALLAAQTVSVSAHFRKIEENNINTDSIKTDFSLRIIHVNDHHSHIEPETYEIVPDSSFPASLQGLTKIPVKVGGWPLLTSAINDAEDEGKDMGMEVLKLHAGDAITGTIFYTLFEGEPDADFMNSVCFDAFALGNHEFDNGDSGLAVFLDFLDASAGKDSGCPKTPVLAANVVPGPDSPLIGRLASYEIFSYGGREVGVIGLDTRSKTLQSSFPDEGTDLLDEVTVATVLIPELKAMGVDIIILLTHVGLDFDLTNLATLPDVDVVVGGDSHTFMGYTAPVAIEEKSREYPEYVFKPDGTITCVVQAYQYAVLFGVLDVVFDEDGNIVSCRGNPIVPFDSTGANLTTTQQADLDSFLDGPLWKATKPDEKAAEDLDVFVSEGDELRQMVIAFVPEDICFERIPGQGRSAICPCSESETMGGGVCNVVAKAFLDVTPTADFAIQNAGGCRTDIPMGNFTYADAYTLLPFSNTLVTLDLTGQQVIDVLNEAFVFSAAPDGSGTGAYPYASGIRWTVEYPTPGVKETTVEFNSQLAGSWTAINPMETYTVVTNSFIAAGKDGYTTFANGTNVVDTYTEYAQAFVEYAEKVGVLEDLPDDEYSTQAITGGLVCPPP